MEIRNCSGCIVVRKVEGKLRYLVVRNKAKRQWVFPKGGVEPDMTSVASAEKEVYEEAGVDCKATHSLGTYRYVKGDMIQNVELFAAIYLGDSEHWPEEDIRERKWKKRSDVIRAVGPNVAPLFVEMEKFLEGVTAWKNF